MFISERSTGHSVGLLRYLERTGVLLPPQLLSFVQGVLTAREEQKTDRPVCSYVKATGVCRSAAIEVPVLTGFHFSGHKTQHRWAGPLKWCGHDRHCCADDAVFLCVAETAVGVLTATD